MQTSIKQRLAGIIGSIVDTLYSMAKIFYGAKFMEIPPRPFRRNFEVFIFAEQAHEARATHLPVDGHSQKVNLVT